MKLAITTIGAAVALALSAPVLGQQQQQQGSQQQQAQGEKLKGIVTASGKVVGNAEIKTTAGDLHDLVKLQRTNGDTVVVDLGVGSPQIEKGDQIFVHGTAARISGKPVIFARYVAELQPAGMAGAPSASAGGTADDGSDAQWDADDWQEDEFGYYDEDFEWTSDNSGFTDFYGDADDAWDAYYDDVGDEGLFDI